MAMVMDMVIATVRARAIVTGMDMDMDTDTHIHSLDQFRGIVARLSYQDQPLCEVRLALADLPTEQDRRSI
jgi:hypothetical protein